MTVEFGAAWCATDLGGYRPCRYTYDTYPYESLPPLDSGRFVGAFEWLGEAGAPVPERVRKIGELDRLLGAEGLALPGDFVAFHSASGHRWVLAEVSVTGCWSSFSEPLRSPVEAGAFLVRFLRDQQDCVFWYLYLRPSGESFVVWSHVDFAYGEGEGAGQIHWCAPTFEEFAYRFWVENRLWGELDDGGEEALEPELRAYLAHYASPGGAGGDVSG